MGFVTPPGEAQLEIRLANFEAEKRSLRMKLNNPDVPTNKKKRCEERLWKLEHVIIPRTMRDLGQSPR
ncbi:MAG: hypothetical protein HYW97_00975 [Candidatus Wildermuthbacteria bacterium]|nr:hypothetical protein [Candidatus Wildermuthbacteria bacterium]